MDDQVGVGDSVALPRNATRRRTVFRALCGVSISTVGLVWLANYAFVGSKAATAIERDPRNADAGISVSAHYAYYIDPNSVVLDVRGFRKASCLDMMRVLFSFAGEMRSHRYSRLILEYRGTAKFMLSGSYFQNLGDEFTLGQNPIYLVRTLPENTSRIDGTPAFGQWTGGWLGVLGKQMEDVNSFCKEWMNMDVPS